MKSPQPPPPINSSLGRPNCYERYSDCLRAVARQQGERWTPGTSGGDYAPDRPPSPHTACRPDSMWIATAFSFPQRPAALTQLGAARHFYGVSRRDARTPQAKGKIERQQQSWQGRRPARFAAETITPPAAANALRPDLRRHRNDHASQREQRRVRRPTPRCAWWPYLWRVRMALKAGPDGRVPIGHERLRVGVAVGTRVSHGRQPKGSIRILASEPKTGERPALRLPIRAP